MAMHFSNEMSRLHRDIVAMCSKVEELINDAVRGLRNRSSTLAAELVIRDQEVNQLDVQIEEECLKILALYHPVANDLRRVAVVLKIIGELERVGDLAVNIAERSMGIAPYPDFMLPDRLDEMASESLSMLHSSIDAYLELDTEKAREVCKADDGVDSLNVELLNELRAQMSADPSLVEPGMHLFSCIRHIERVADHATNIAEDVVYMIEGEIIRHPHLRDSESE
ncbi:MAG TPA: phosphate transport system regulatory protein PhoU [Planctomycetaceae bacterium]|nr:phosphate transport system regulatory protein PhoU [Planctomycetaceae bacterium]